MLTRRISQWRLSCSRSIVCVCSDKNTRLTFLAELNVVLKRDGGVKRWAHTDRHADGQVFTFLWLRWNVRTSCQCCIKGRSKNCPMGWKTGIIPQFSQIPSGQKNPIGLFLLFSFSSFDFTVVEPKPVWIILIGCLVQTGWFELWCFCLEQSILRRFHHSCVEWCHYQVMEKPLNRLEMIP